MASKGKRFEENAAGKFYVTDECNGCGRCFSVALQNFMYSNDASYYYILNQPADEREVEDIKDAIAVCQMDCIFDDGDKVPVSN